MSYPNQGPSHPSTENHTNELTEEGVQSAIQQVLEHSHVQSYDEFVQSFTRLTTADVASYVPPTADNYPQIRAESPQNSASASHMSGETRQGVIVQQGIEHSAKEFEEDVLDVEELEEFEMYETPREGIERDQDKKFVQVDNFMSDDDNSDDDYLDALSDLDDDIGELLADTISPYQLTGPVVSRGLTKEVEDDLANEKEIDGEVDSDFDSSHTMHDVILPGESEESTPVNPEIHFYHQTKLPVGLVARSEEDGVTGEVQSIPTNIVEPFSLDPNFDYDNVILTPKWRSVDLPNR